MCFQLADASFSLAPLSADEQCPLQDQSPLSPSPFPSVTMIDQVHCSHFQV